MLPMHDVIFMVGFANIVGRDAAADPCRISRMSMCFIFIFLFLSLRKQLLYKLDIYHKINICRNAVACYKKIMLFSYTHVISYQSNRWLFFSFY